MDGLKELDDKIAQLKKTRDELTKAAEADNYAESKVISHWDKHSHPSWNNVTSGEYDQYDDLSGHVDHFKRTGKLKDVPDHMKLPVPETKDHRAKVKSIDRNYKKQSIKKKEHEDEKEDKELIAEALDELTKAAEADNYAESKVISHWDKHSHPSWNNVTSGEYDQYDDLSGHVDHFKRTGKLKDVPDHMKLPVPETKDHRAKVKSIDRNYKKQSIKKKEHEDEKEDKELIAEALDEHNEKKHGEAKDKDSAFKAEKIEVAPEGSKNRESYQREFVKFEKNGQWNLETLEKSESTKYKMDRAFEAHDEATSDIGNTFNSNSGETSKRKAKYGGPDKKDLKTKPQKDMDVEKACGEMIKFEKNGQWSMSKGDTMAPRPKSKLDVPVKDVYNGDDHTKEIGGKSVDGDKGKTVKAGKNP